MSTVVSRTHLDTNLACLGERNADVVELIRSTPARSDVEFVPSAQGVFAATLGGRQLCSRHQPLDEAARLVDDIDLVEHAVIVMMGFGLGYHVQQLAKRAGKATLIIVYEPDVGLLRAVLEQIDHSRWMRDALLLIITDGNDRGRLGAKLQGAESILAQGVHFVDHPASRTRLGAGSQHFMSLFAEFISAAKTTLMTTLMRSVDTTRNLMLNLDHYGAGDGISDLRNIARSWPAIVVSAGPSLHRNMHLLKDPEVRERCIIIAVQTTLKPLLNAGIRPHFVTALDYHEISKRFYEGLTADDVRDVTLIADPKAHPVILDSFPGPIRCCANPFLDNLLGDLKRDMGELPAGATVAHLAVYVAKCLGCDPIVLIGQDLGFTDGLYYAPGTAIHDVWAPELNAFNTVEMMEWQRIARHRLHLKKMKDIHGKSIYSDAQMLTYLQQFERDFGEYKREGLTIIDASEGGVEKQHTIIKPLAEVIEQHVSTREPLPTFPMAGVAPDERRAKRLRKRLGDVRADVIVLRDVSRKTADLLERMIEQQHDVAAMARHFEKIERHRKEVDARLKTFELLNALNQIGVFNRMKADRRLHMQQGLTPLQKQRVQLERDLINVRWIADAGQELLDQLDAAERVVDGQEVVATTAASQSKHLSNVAIQSGAVATIAAMIAIDPHCNGLGVPRDLAAGFNGRTVLQATLERLGQSRRIGSIVLIVPKEFDVDALIDRSRIRVPIEAERVEGSPFGHEHEAIAAARLWAGTCWRGGIGGMSIYDEVFCPQTMWPIMQRRGLTAALIIGPDWPLVRVTDAGGCDDVIVRHLAHPQKHNLVFTQSPPGLCGCLVSATLTQELSTRNRLSTIGGLLVYQPHAPQGDPIARDANVQIEHELRRSLSRYTFDSVRYRKYMVQQESSLPQFVTLELNTDRTSIGLFRRQRFGDIRRDPMTLELVRRVFEQIAAFGMDDIALTLDGTGDPLLHPQFDQFIQLAKANGIRGVHVRTELLVDLAILDRLLASGVDVISIDLNADRAATYQAMMGCDRFKDVLLNIEYLLSHRKRLTSHAGNAAFALPWIVPRLQRCAATYEDIDTFFDRWQQTLGCAVIDGVSAQAAQDGLAPAVTPQVVLDHEQSKTLTVRCDGSVPFDCRDFSNGTYAGNIQNDALSTIWQRRHLARPSKENVT